MQFEERELDTDRPYWQGVRRIDRMIDEGVSFSGNEANCAFLNLGDTSFATVSALSGFDFPDDARALALVDWDRDGDLDVWVTNRTGPTLRFLRNDAPGGAALLVRLEGLTTNRDAVGARVEVRLRGEAERPLIHTVKRGEGFLGQGSGWLHFGLGRDPVIDSVKVRWPGGRTDEINGVQPNTAVTFTQGDSAPVSTPLKPRADPTPATPLEPIPPVLAGAVTLFHLLPFPALPSQRADGTPWSVDDTAGPTLINVFASWCPDCTTELKDWAGSAEAFRSAGVTPVLLCADGRDETHDTAPSQGFAWLERNKIPFTSGLLTDEAFRRLNRAHQQAFGAVVTLPVPTSFLLDGHGRLAAVYRGPVTASAILSDVAAIAKKGARSTVPTSLPFPGRWLQEPESPDPSFWLNDFAASDAWEEAFAFFQRHLDTLRRHRDFVLIAGALGDKLAAAGRPGPAITCHRAALAKSPDHPGVLNNLATLLATTSDPALRRPKEAVTLAAKASQLSSDRSPAILDTLAAAHAADGNFADAIATAERALALARALPDQVALIPVLEKALAAYRDNQQP